MKRPKPELHNNRVIRFTVRALSLPYAGAAAACRATVALLQSLKSPERVRAEGARRQSRVRRQLRGLAGDHVRES